MKAIVAVDETWGIGKSGQLLCPIRADLRRFRSLTLGHPVILGRKTLATFPGGRPLPERLHLILSRTPDFSVEGALVFPDLDGLLSAAPDDSIVIGGGTVYRQLLKFCKEVYVTRILGCFDADTFFPNLNAMPEWTAKEEGPILEENGIHFRYVTYCRSAEPWLSK